MSSANPPQENLPPYDSGWVTELPNERRGTTGKFAPLAFACAAYTLFSPTAQLLYPISTALMSTVSMLLITATAIVLFIAGRRNQGHSPVLVAIIAVLIGVPLFFVVSDANIVKSVLLRLAVPSLLGFAGTVLGIVGRRKGEHLGGAAALASAATSVNALWLFIGAVIIMS